MSRHRKHTGFAAIAAIFLLVLLAALGAFMLSFSNTQQLTSAQDVQGSRAYWAARAGLEWGLAGVDASVATMPSATCPLTAQPATINGFALAFVCDRRVYTEDGVDRIVFRLTAAASGGGAVGSVGYIERSVSASVEY
ncbi:hypothetical protein [Rhodoferax sp.]|uniref:hypothetical protein n=1 Tax=Rhodoferax sp. TaxID=50421 RepID=UPI0027715470|nr:hypothetical protein [Rhodoferax sp.]